MRAPLTTATALLLLTGGGCGGGGNCPRRSLGPGTYRIWVQAFSSQPEPAKIGADIGVWGERCGGAGL